LECIAQLHLEWRTRWLGTGTTRQVPLDEHFGA
jgi:hypothetical protein